MQIKPTDIDMTSTIEFLGKCYVDFSARRTQADIAISRRHDHVSYGDQRPGVRSPSWNPDMKGADLA
jgi:hypothetical protein